MTSLLLATYRASQSAVVKCTSLPEEECQMPQSFFTPHLSWSLLFMASAMNTMLSSAIFITDSMSPKYRGSRNNFNSSGKYPWEKQAWQRRHLQFILEKKNWLIIFFKIYLEVQEWRMSSSLVSNIRYAHLCVLCTHTHTPHTTSSYWM